MHDLVVSRGWVDAFDFWRMTPGQIWWLIEAKTPAQIVERARDMSEVVRMVKSAKMKDPM